MGELKTLVFFKCGPYICYMPGQRMSSGVVKHLTNALWTCLSPTFPRKENSCLLVKLQPGKGRVDEKTVEHVRLLIVMRCQNDVVDNMFKSLTETMDVNFSYKNTSAACHSLHAHGR